jgi:NAD(P)H-hydrate epimerase
MTTPRTITCSQARELDRRAVEEFGIPGIVLMENAGRGVADTLSSLGMSGPVLICCGRGNNGGDGFVVARHLDLRGQRVRVLLLADPAKLEGDALSNYRVVVASGIPLAIVETARLPQELAGAGWIVDALLGTGARGEPRPPFDAAIDAINGSGVPVLAVDLPSGLDADTGQAAMHTIRAAHTCTFVAVKPGFLVPGAAAYTGQVHVLDIGAPRRLVDEIVGH